MIIRVPITGKVTKWNPETRQGEGDEKNKIRPLDFNKLFPDAKFKWEVKIFDIEKAVALVELTFEKLVTVTEWDNSKKPPEPLAWRTETDAQFWARKADFNILAWETLISKTPDELYQLTGEPKLEMP